MKRVYTILSLALALSACGQQSASVEALKSSIGLTRDQVEIKFGKPASSNINNTDFSPGGYWVYNVASGGSCKIHFDLPPRVTQVDC